MNIPLARSYWPAMLTAVGVQLLCVVLSAMVLDGGNAAMLCVCTMVGFWVGALLMILQHPEDPTDTDLRAIRFGFLPLYLMGFVIVEVFIV